MYTLCVDDVAHNGSLRKPLCINNKKEATSWSAHSRDLHSAFRMGDTALWESELLRARQWLQAERLDRMHGSEQIFTRVNAHLAYIDHKHSLQSETVVSDDEDDLALDFLGDVDASDMNALLQAEAAKAAAAAPSVENGPLLVSHMPSAGELLQPLKMPTHLASPKLKSTNKPVATSQLDSKRATTTMASATLGTDAAVQELMQDLHLDVTRHPETEEVKTEESTPPHLQMKFGDAKAKTSGVSTGQGGAGKEKQVKHIYEISSKSQQNSHKKVVVPVTITSAEEAGAEMSGWVSGCRDPEVIRRKEKLATRKRKHPHRFGVSSEEEQLQVLHSVKQIIDDSNSDSESQDDLSSDYSPAEEEEIPEPDEPEVVDLLSDDYLDSDDETRPVKRKRKRLRRADTAPAKPRSRKPSKTRKLDNEKPFTTESDTKRDARPSVNSSERNAKKAAIHLLSSEDEMGDSDKASILKPVQRAAQSKVSNNVQSSQIQESGPAEVNTAIKRSVSAEIEATVATKPISSHSVAYEQVRQKEKPENLTHVLDTIEQPIDDVADDADLSDTGTVDFEGEDLSLENDEYAHNEEANLTSEAPDSGASVDKEVNPGSKPEELESITRATVEVQKSDKEDEDVSEAETEILEDDEPDTDDLGPDYSDDNDPDDVSAGDKNNNVSGSPGTADDKKDVAADKKDPASSTTTTGGHAASKESPNDKGENSAANSSTAGVHQFFDFAPLKLKPNVKSTTTTAPKPLPVHNYAETHVRNGKTSTSTSKVPAELKKVSAALPSKPSAGSNGLRPSKKPIATTTTRKGKYLHTRRSTKLLDDTLKVTEQPKSRYTMVPTRKPKNAAEEEDELDDMPLLTLAKRNKESGGTSKAKYLSYAGAKKTEDVPTNAAVTHRIVPKSRYGGAGINLRTPAQPDPPATSNGQHSQVNDKPASRGGFRQEPQISIYDALHVEGQESANDIRDGAGYKRPSRFKKMQEEAARNGTPIVRSRLQDTDWDKVPIPKKKKQAPHVEKPARNLPSKVSSVNNYKPRNAMENTQKKRRNKNVGSSNKNSGPSYYGPKASQSGENKYDSPSRRRRGRENNHSNRDDERRRKRSLSPLPRERDRYERDGKLRDDRRRRGSSRSRSRSRSLSPRGRDYGSSRNRRHSRSNSRSREKSSERDHRRMERSPSNGRDRDTNASRNPPSTTSRESSSQKDGSLKNDLPELGEINQNGRVVNVDSSPKKQNISHYPETPPSPGALATFEDDGVFISDSDDDENAFKEVEDIRFDLESVAIDETLMLKRVYVTGVNPTVCAEQIEEDFARFGVAVDRDTGYPAIDIFPCQRSHLGRGDACVTFVTEASALEAVEELNSKNVKNSMIRVRQMDVHTQRILTVQFQKIRDTWRCTDRQCRADVSVWNAKCDKCGRKRVYAPSNIEIGVESWLCSLCFTANDSLATNCHGCKESLPEVERSAFYSS